MDSAAGHRMAPETMAVAEKRETGPAEVLPVSGLPGGPFEPAGEPDEAQTAWAPDEALTEWAPPARGSRAPLW